MPHEAPVLVQLGPCAVYVRSAQGSPDLLPVAQALPAGMPVMWCDSARRHPVTGRWSMLGYLPWLTLTARDDHIELRTSAATHVWREHPLEALQQVMRRYRLRSGLGAVGRAVGLMGCLSYDLNRWIERLPAPPPRWREAASRGLPAMPDLVWCGMRVVILVDHAENRTWLISVVDPHGPQPLARHDAREALREAEARLAAAKETGVTGAGRACGPGAGSPVGALSLEPTSTQAEFHAMVRRVLEHIRAGDIFQANVSQRFTTAWRGAAFDLYRTLRRINPSPFACFLSFQDLAVVSCSPERLVRVQDGRVDTRPIAGTRPRGANPAEDAINSLDLLVSEKERAEHIMLVDLERNDLGRICETGSIGVSELMALEEYSHVIHIVSDVSGRLRRGLDAVDVIRAVFPGGTITGCPKVRCMEILQGLEPVRRGLYTGSLGYLGFDGTMDLNIAIRTIVLRGERLSFHVGAGIVADSDPGREYQETLAKAGALVSALRTAGGPPRYSHAAPR